LAEIPQVRDIRTAARVETTGRAFRQLRMAKKVSILGAIGNWMYIQGVE